MLGRTCACHKRGKKRSRMQRTAHSSATTIYIKREESRKEEEKEGGKEAAVASTERFVLKEAKALASALEKFELLLKVKYESGDITDALESKIYDRLSVPLCRITKKIVPSVQRKIDEIVYADEKKMTVCKEEHGADLEDVEGNRHELKVSTCKKGTNYKCNFNWPVPTGKNVDTRRSKLLYSVIEKTNGNSIVNLDKILPYDVDEPVVYRGGEFKMIARDIKGQTVLNEYSLSGPFVYHYFKKLPDFPGSKVYNFGCERCVVCDEYHRLKRLKEYDTSLMTSLSKKIMKEGKIRWSNEGEEDAFVSEAVNWKEVFSKNVKAQCKG